MVAERALRFQGRILRSSYCLAGFRYSKLHIASSISLLVRVGTVPFGIDLIIGAVFEQDEQSPIDLLA